MTSRQSASEADKLVRRYLAQLDAALRGVDASRRQEIRAEVHRHIEQGRTGLDRDDVASVRALLSRAGDPAAIAAKAGASPPASRRWDAWAPWLIIFGPAASGLGWIAGVLILWTSPTWSRRDKLIATFVPPPAWWLFSSASWPRCARQLAVRGTFSPRTRRLVARPAGSPSRSESAYCWS